MHRAARAVRASAALERLARIGGGGTLLHVPAADAIGRSPALAAAGGLLLAWQTESGVHMRQIAPQ